MYFQLSTLDESKFLFQCEDEFSMKEWCSVIRDNMDQSEVSTVTQCEIDSRSDYGYNCEGQLKQLCQLYNN